MAPLALRWLFRNTNIGGVYAVPLIGDAVCHSPETKALVLLGLLLIAAVLILKTLRG
jgi:hypothetical protein